MHTYIHARTHTGAPPIPLPYTQTLKYKTFIHKTPYKQHTCIHTRMNTHNAVAIHAGINIRITLTINTHAYTHIGTPTTLLPYIQALTWHLGPAAMLQCHCNTLQHTRRKALGLAGAGSTRRATRLGARCRWRHFMAVPQVCCNVLQYVAVCWHSYMFRRVVQVVLFHCGATGVLQCVLQCVAVCCSVLALIYVSARVADAAVSWRCHRCVKRALCVV